MGRNNFRVGVWLMALVTCFAIAGTHSAYAWDNGQKPRVQGGGFFNTPNPLAPNGTAKVTFSVTGRCADGSMACGGSTQAGARGRYEYFNHATGMRARGNLQTIQFGPASAACGLDDPNVVGHKAALVTGQGDDGSTFKMELVDSDDSQPVAADHVCQVHVAGTTKTLMPVMPDDDPSEPVIKGSIEVRNVPLP